MAVTIGFTNLNIRKFSPILLRQIKSIAALEGKTLRQWVIDAISEKVERRIAKIEGERRRIRRQK